MENCSHETRVECVRIQAHSLQVSLTARAPMKQHPAIQMSRYSLLLLARAFDVLNLCIPFGSDLSSDGASLEANCAFNVAVCSWSHGQFLFDFAHFIWDVFCFWLLCSVGQTTVDLDFIGFQGFCWACDNAFFAISAQVVFEWFIHVKFSRCKYSD